MLSVVFVFLCLDTFETEFLCVITLAALELTL